MTVDMHALKVLVADDEPAMLSLISRYMKGLGFSVIEASEGDSAWDLAQRHRPDLVILDVMMPGMSGWEICKRLKSQSSNGGAFADTGVIMLTGIGENLNEMTSPLFAADAWLNKPFDFADLDQRIRETLGRYDKTLPSSAAPPPMAARTEGEAEWEEPPEEGWSVPPSAPVLVRDEDIIEAEEDELDEEPAETIPAQFIVEEVDFEIAPASTKRAPARPRATQRPAAKKKAPSKRAAKAAAKRGAAKAGAKRVAAKASARRGAAKAKPKAKAKTSAKSAKRGAAKAPARSASKKRAAAASKRRPAKAAKRPARAKKR